MSEVDLAEGLHDFLPLFSEIHGAAAKHNRQHLAMKAGDVAQFAVSDTSMYALQDSLDDPLQ